MMDIRDAFFESLYALAEKDRNVIVLSDDQGAMSLEKFKKQLPHQYFNAGIAEQNIISVAAGMALGGKRPFVYGITTFVSMRCFEQLKVDLSCMKLPVTVVGSGAGYTYGSDGPTHHAAQDVALLRTLPEMTIYNPTDAAMTAAVARLAYRADGPVYIRMEKGILPVVYQPNHDFSDGFAVVRPGKDLTIVATGFVVPLALKVAEALGSRSLHVGVIDLYRIKPVGAKLLSALTAAKRLVTLEEHTLIGGIGSLICEVLADAGQQRPVKRIGLPDENCYLYGNRDWLHEQHGLTVEKLSQTILAWAKSGGDLQ